MAVQSTTAYIGMEGFIVETMEFYTDQCPVVIDGPGGTKRVLVRCKQPVPLRALEKLELARVRALVAGVLCIVRSQRPDYALEVIIGRKALVEPTIETWLKRANAAIRNVQGRQVELASAFAISSDVTLGDMEVSI